MVLVLVNMSHFGFSPCKKKLLFFVPANMSCFGFSPCKKKFVVFGPWGLISKPKYFAGTFLKIRRFCGNYFSHKWIQSSCVTCANHHKSGVRD